MNPMPPVTTAVIMFRFALGGALGASPVIFSAFRIAIIVAAVSCDPAKIWTQSQLWDQAASQLDVATTRMGTAKAKVLADWIAQDRDAYTDAESQYVKEVGDTKSFLTGVATALRAVAIAYAAFAVLAVVVVGFVVLCLVSVLATMATPAYPAMKSFAEATTNAVAFVAAGAAKALGMVVASASALLLADVGLWLAAEKLRPSGEGGADFQQITMDYQAPSYNPPPGGYPFVAPKRDLPARPN